MTLSGSKFKHLPHSNNSPLVGQRVLRCLFWVAFYFTTSAQVFSAVLVKQKMWPKNSTLNVVFIDGNIEQKQKVRQIAPLWLNNSSLKFQFFDNFATAPKQTHIRVSFSSYTGSTLGNHGDLSSQTPTLLLAELNQTDLPEIYANRLILHEFGHALGLEHEYRNPDWPFGQAPINQQIEHCLPRLESLGYATMEAKHKCQEINAPLNENNIYKTIYDEFSIMNYPQTFTLADQSQKHILAVSKLSILDKLAIERWYGK